jgi:hypothetical protein
MPVGQSSCYVSDRCSTLICVNVRKSANRHFDLCQTAALFSHAKQKSEKLVNHMPKTPTRESAKQPVTHEMVLELIGEIGNAKITAILAAGPTLEDLEEAIAWATGESDVMGEERLPLAGVAAQVYEILTVDEDYNNERR